MVRLVAHTTRFRVRAEAEVMTMDEAKLSEIEARASSATPGPWLMEHDVWHPVIRQSQFDGFGPIVCREANGDSGLRWHPNADFISHAREDVPALVAEVRRLREALEAAAIHARHKALEEAVELVKGLAEDARDDGDGSDDAASLALEDAGEALLSLRADK